MLSSYYDKSAVAAGASQGAHRDIIGGLWNEIGDLQLEFLRSNGMTKDSQLLDIGCGSLRLGVRATDFLNSGHYWGTDLNESLLDAGYDKEIVPAGLADKLPRENLVRDGDFNFPGIPHRIDFAIAQSLFTHLPINRLRLCLSKSGHACGGRLHLLRHLFHCARRRSGATFPARARWDCHLLAQGPLSLLPRRHLLWRLSHTLGGRVYWRLGSPARPADGGVSDRKANCGGQTNTGQRGKAFPVPCSGAETSDRSLGWGETLRSVGWRRPCLEGESQSNNGQDGQIRASRFPRGLDDDAHFAVIAHLARSI